MSLAAAAILLAVAVVALSAGRSHVAGTGSMPAQAQPVSFPEAVAEIGVADDAVWALDEHGAGIWRAAPGERPTRQQAPAGTTQLAAGPAGVWSGGDEGAVRVDRTDAPAPLADPPDDIAVADDGVWTLEAAAERIAWISGGRTRHGSAPPGAVAVTAAGDEAWLLGGDGRVHRMRAGDEPTVDSGGVESGLPEPEVLAADGRTVWVLDRDDGTLARVDPDSERGVIVEDDLGDVTGMAAGDGSLWLARSDGTAFPYRPPGQRVK